MNAFYALSAGFFYTLLISFADATASRILTAYYHKSRKKIHRKWHYILSGRSKCDSCGQTITSVALIPIWGFVFCKGKCHHCHESLPKRHFYQECSAFLYGLAIGYYHTDVAYILATGMYLLVLTIAMRIDWAYLLIPTEIILFLLVFSIAELLLRLGHLPFTTTELLQGDYSVHLLIAFVWYFLFYLIRILSRYQMGLADVRLVLILSIALGYPLALYYPTLAAALGIAFYLGNRFLLRKKANIADKGLKTKLAFGVFLGIGFLFLRIL